jgi:hypothetical protein
MAGVWQAYFATTGREPSSSTSLSSNFTFEGIPEGPYMTDMDEVTTHGWGSLILENVHLSDYSFGRMSI